MLVEACEIFENGTIGNFSQGGGLYSENGSLTIRGSRIFSNTTNGAVSEGGGLGLRSTTVLEDSEVSDNETLASSSGGGGVYTDDEFLARNTTFSGNVVGAATGIQGYSVGGAFASVGFGNAAFEACTIVDNRAPSGTGQGGGISTFSRGQISFFSTILIGNDAVDLERIPNAITRFIDRGYNLFGIGSGFDLIEERQGTSVYGVSSDEGILDVLDFYGGPTRSHRLSVGGSNTIDFGPTRSIYEAETGEAAFFDQRGVDFPRSSGERLDVGAYEFQTFLDRDNDGLPDAVEEIVEGLNPDLPDAELDLDGDGIRNYDEYVQLGILAINDRERFLRPSISSLTGFEEVQLNFQTSPNREYRLRFGEGLSEELMTEQTDFLRFLGESKGAITIPVSEERMFFRVESRIPEELLDNSL